MSSLSSQCDHLSHVGTQMPYALTVGGVAMLLGVLPTALGLLHDPERIRQIERNVAPLARLDAAQTIVDEVYKLI